MQEDARKAGVRERINRDRKRGKNMYNFAILFISWYIHLGGFYYARLLYFIYIPYTCNEKKKKIYI